MFWKELCITENCLKNCIWKKKVLPLNNLKTVRLSISPTGQKVVICIFKYPYIYCINMFPMTFVEYLLTVGYLSTKSWVSIQIHPKFDQSITLVWTFFNQWTLNNVVNKPNKKQEHSDIELSAYFAKLGKKKVNEEKEIEKHRKSIHGSHLQNA